MEQFGALHQKRMCLGCWNDAVETDLGSSLQLCAYLHVMGGQQQAAVLWLRKGKLLPLISWYSETSFFFRQKTIESKDTELDVMKNFKLEMSAILLQHFRGNEID